MILNKQYMSKNNKNKQRQALSIEEIYCFRGYLEKRFRISLRENATLKSAVFGKT